MRYVNNIDDLDPDPLLRYLFHSGFSFIMIIRLDAGLHLYHLKNKEILYSEYQVRSEGPKNRHYWMILHAYLILNNPECHTHYIDRYDYVSCFVKAKPQFINNNSRK